MKLSNDTLQILKNFSSINQSIYIRSGNLLRTMSIMQNVVGQAIIEETFDKDFAIYDLNQFLSGLKLHDSPELNFDNDSYLTIVEGKRKVKYFFSDPSVIVCPPDKELIVPSKEVDFQLDHSQLKSLLDASNVYRMFDFSVIGSNGVIKLSIRDKENDTSNEFSIIVGETDKEFCFNFKIDNIKIILGSYDVVISNSLISKFTHKTRPITYWIALEQDSKGVN